MNARLLGVLVFGVIAIGAVAYGLFGSELGGGPKPVRAMGFIGGEKRNLLANPKIQRILERQRVRFDYRKAGSVEMVTEQRLLSQNPDLLWPGSQVQVEMARANGVKILKDEIIFNSPIVLYSWAPVAKALVKRGIARPLNQTGAAYAVDTKKLIELILAETKWSDLGVQQLYGNVVLVSTDPNKSNSGNQFAALMVQVLSNGATQGPALEQAIAKVASIYRRMGYMSHSSGDLFEQYLRTGMGAKPLVAGYESQLIEFAFTQGDLWKSLKDRAARPVILYPEPTVYSSHVVLALTKAGSRVAEALKDKELQDIAWREHGFRSGFAGAQDAATAPIKGLPSTIGKVVPMPPVRVVNQILQRLRTN